MTEKNLRQQLETTFYWFLEVNTFVLGEELDCIPQYALKLAQEVDLECDLPWNNS